MYSIFKGSLSSFHIDSIYAQTSLDRRTSPDMHHVPQHSEHSPSNRRSAAMAGLHLIASARTGDGHWLQDLHSKYYPLAVKVQHRIPS